MRNAHVATLVHDTRYLVSMCEVAHIGAVGRPFNFGRSTSHEGVRVAERFYEAMIAGDPSRRELV
jgi:hypothetical protein